MPEANDTGRRMKKMSGSTRRSCGLSSVLWAPVAVVVLSTAAGLCDGFAPSFFSPAFVSSRIRHDNTLLYMLKDQNNDDDEFTQLSAASSSAASSEHLHGGALVHSNANGVSKKRGLDLMWCGAEHCKESIRERVVGEDNHFEFDGPATGQVCFMWNEDEDRCIVDEDEVNNNTTANIEAATAAVLFLVKRDDDELLQTAANAIKELTESGVNVYLVPELAAKIEYNHGVHNGNVKLFEPRTSPGFGGNHVPIDDKWMAEFNHYDAHVQEMEQSSPVDLICTLGGDGLLMHANVMFQGAVPPILCVAGGSLGFLTPFSRDEMVEAIRVSLGMVRGDNGDLPSHLRADDDPVAIKPYDVLRQRDHYFNGGNHNGESSSDGIPKFSCGLGNRICLSMRMRLECKVINREGVVRARFNVLNEVTVDRGSSPYLAALECFCDNVHLTTVQADGVIFAT